MEKDLSRPSQRSSHIDVEPGLNIDTCSRASLFVWHAFNISTLEERGVLCLVSPPHHLLKILFRLPEVVRLCIRTVVLPIHPPVLSV